VALLLGHGHSTAAQTEPTGAALALFAVGLPGFCVYLYVIRALQTMQRTKVAFYLYLIENAINVALAVVLVHPLGVRGLALSLSVAYSVGALIGLAVLRRWFGSLGTRSTWAPLRRVGLASVAMGATVLVVSNISGAMHGVALLLRVLGSVVAGLAVYGAVAVLLGRREQLRHGRRRRVSIYRETGRR
jgi:putative peptidoglycan lipid II flippase